MNIKTTPIEILKGDLEKLSSLDTTFKLNMYELDLKRYDIKELNEVVREYRDIMITSSLYEEMVQKEILQGNISPTFKEISIVMKDLYERISESAYNNNELSRKGYDEDIKNSTIDLSKVDLSNIDSKELQEKISDYPCKIKIAKKFQPKKQEEPLPLNSLSFGKFKGVELDFKDDNDNFIIDNNYLSWVLENFEYIKDYDKNLIVSTLQNRNSETLKEQVKEIQTIQKDLEELKSFGKEIESKMGVLDIGSQEHLSLKTLNELNRSKIKELEEKEFSILTNSLQTPVETNREIIEINNTLSILREEQKELELLFAHDEGEESDKAYSKYNEITEDILKLQHQREVIKENQPLTWLSTNDNYWLNDNKVIMMSLVGGTIETIREDGWKIFEGEQGKMKPTTRLSETQALKMVNEKRRENIDLVLSTEISHEDDIREEGLDEEDIQSRVKLINQELKDLDKSYYKDEIDEDEYEERKEEYYENIQMLESQSEEMEEEINFSSSRDNLPTLSTDSDKEDTKSSKSNKNKR